MMTKKDKRDDGYVELHTPIVGRSAEGSSNYQDGTYFKYG